MNKILLILALSLMIITGCAGFIPLKEEPFCEKITVSTFTVYVQEVCQTKDGKKVAGWYDPNTGNVCVWAAKWNDEYELILKILGHEIAHKLNHINPRIRNPDLCP